MSFMPFDKNLWLFSEGIALFLLIVITVFVYFFIKKNKVRKFLITFFFFLVLVLTIDWINTFSMFKSLDQITSFESLVDDNHHYAIRHSRNERFVNEKIGYEVYSEISLKQYLGVSKDLISNYSFFNKFFTEYVIWVDSRHKTP